MVYFSNIQSFYFIQIITKYYKAHLHCWRFFRDKSLANNTSYSAVIRVLRDKVCKANAVLFHEPLLFLSGDGARWWEGVISTCVDDVTLTSRLSTPPHPRARVPLPQWPCIESMTHLLAARLNPQVSTGWL